MSAPDEFDPMIERLFGRSPSMPDSEAFARRVEQRLDRGWIVRTLALSSAGVVGGLIAVRQTLASGLVLDLGGGSRRADLGDSAAGAWRTAEQMAASVLNPDLGAMGGMQLFWLLSAALIAAAAITAVSAVNEG